MIAMKRSREEDRQVEAEAMANCALMLLSRLNNNNTTSTDGDYLISSDCYHGFECKTCNKRFPSFQALGGHRASHKRPRLLAGAGEFLMQAKKNKMHECSICGMEFSLGQALGGHMRRHQKTPSLVAGKTMTPMLKKSNSSKRIFCGLDLNLSPDENVELKLWPTTPVSSPVLRCFI
ncbi:PREDICTED: zinc finger protein ZAT12-like [Nicotiana attenuata]|uniref:zinc finger protein ZAT12-like n=1 Tax=Nicotiana attenuata TaxID=49451 RepID=UPI000904C56E|nr:PREDICTED: zinc finger protein ZAT12-like [Nicotiana attenuata]